MRIINIKKLQEFAQEHASARDALYAWYDDVVNANWNNPTELAQRYGWDVVSGTRAIFKIKGNDYRLVVKINYSLQAIDIRFIGTHSEYNKIDATKI